MTDILIQFQIYLNEKSLINNHDWDFEKEAKNFIKKQQPDVNISVERAQEYGVNQFKRGVLGFEFVELKEWCEKQ